GSRGFTRKGEKHEGVRYIVGVDFAAQKIAAHIISFGYAARFRSRAHHVLGEKPRADAVRVNCIAADAILPVIERVLLHQKERRGLGKTMGAKIFAWVDRLLRGVEQKAAASPLRFHHADRVLRYILMREEIQLERFAQRVVVHFADAALPSSARIGNDDV